MKNWKKTQGIHPGKKCAKFQPNWTIFGVSKLLKVFRQTDRHCRILAQQKLRIQVSNSRSWNNGLWNYNKFKVSKPPPLVVTWLAFQEIFMRNSTDILKLLFFFTAELFFANHKRRWFKEDCHLRHKKVCQFFNSSVKVWFESTQLCSQRNTVNCTRQYDRISTS